MNFFLDSLLAIKAQAGGLKHMEQVRDFSLALNDIIGQKDRPQVNY